jgi:hypothetical protein
MFKVNCLRFVLPLFGLLWAGNVTSLYSASTLPGLKSLSGHVPPLVAKFHLSPSGFLNATNELNLAIGLPLRNRAELDHYLAEISTRSQWPKSDRPARKPDGAGCPGTGGEHQPSVPL